MLELFVKVKEGWRADARAVKNFGFDCP